MKVTAKKVLFVLDFSMEERVYKRTFFYTLEFAKQMGLPVVIVTMHDETTERQKEILTRFENKATQKMSVSCVISKERLGSLGSIGDVIMREAPSYVIMDVPSKSKMEDIPLLKVFYQTFLSVVYRAGVPVIIPSSDIKIADMKNGIIHNIITSIDFKRRFRKISYLLLLVEFFKANIHLFVEHTDDQKKISLVANALFHTQARLNDKKLAYIEKLSSTEKFLPQLLEYPKQLKNSLLLLELNEWTTQTEAEIKQFLAFCGNKTSVMIVKSPQKNYRLIC